MEPRTLTLKCSCGHSFEIPASSSAGDIPCPACKVPVRVQAPEEHLGRILVEKGVVKPEQVVAAAKLQARTPGLRLGEALIRIGAITEDQLRQALGAQDKVTLLCPTCKKSFNVKGYKPGTKVLCKTCNVPLVVPSSVVGSVLDTGAGDLKRAPAGNAVDAGLADLIAGFKIERKLGSGGMGEVFLARQTSLDRLVAIKILPPDLARDQAYVQRFLTEAKSAAKVTHENIVASVDAGESKGRYFFVMEYVDGETVHQIVKREGALPEKRALEIAKMVAKGLRHAHRQGLIHRDIKPANIMLTVDGTAKICDFGLARAMNEADTTAKQGIVQSSPAYASPEQCKGQQNLDHRTDMYSLGVSLFEMLTGKRPFEGDTPNLLFIKHVSAEPPSPKSLRPAVSQAASDLALRLLSKPPDERFAEYDALIAAIDAILAPRPVVVRAPLGSARQAQSAPSWKPMAVKAGAGLAALIVIAIVIGKVAGGGDPVAPQPVVKVVEKTAKLPADVQKVLDETREFENRAASDPAQIPAVKTRWKQLEEHYRNTDHHGAFASALVQFDSRVAEVAVPHAQRAMTEADARAAGGRYGEAIQALRAFPAGFAGTESAARVDAKLAEIEKALADRYAAGKDNFFTYLSSERWDEAKVMAEKLRALVTRPGPQGPEYVKATYKDEIDNLLRQIDTEQVLARERKTKGNPPDAPATTPAVTPGVNANTAPVAAPDYVTILRSPALRADPEKRAAAAGMFGQAGATSALCRAAEAFLLRDDKSWKATPALDEYLASIPLERVDQMTQQQHHAAFLALAKKISAVAEADALQLFACAHLEDLLARNYRLDPETMKQAKLAGAKAVDVWGVPSALGRTLVARQIVQPGTPLDIKRALENAQGSADFATKLVVALAEFLEPNFNPREISETFQKLARLAPPESAVSKFCDTVAQQAKETIQCADCQAQGRVPCKKCGATGQATCEDCKGSGRVPDPAYGGFGFSGRYTIPCKTCKQKGKIIPCPMCGGSTKSKCLTCDGKKIRSAIPSDAFRAHLAAGLCSKCGGTGSLFAHVAYACPSCGGSGRFPVGAAFAAPGPVPAPGGGGSGAAPKSGPNGLNYQYFEGSWPNLPTEFRPAVPVAEGACDSFNPVALQRRTDNYAIRFTAFIEVKQEGAYTFTTNSDDASKLFIGTQEVVNNDNPHFPREASGTIALKPGRHPLRVDFSQMGGGAVLEVFWEGPGIQKQPIPASALFKSK